MALLEVEDIHTHYGAIEALKGVSLTVEEGEVVTLIGSNGWSRTLSVPATPSPQSTERPRCMSPS